MHTRTMLSIAPSNTQALSIGEVVETYGLTFDQLRYWDRLGILVPERVGNQRVYYRDHLEQLATIQRLLSGGWTPLKVKLWLQLQNLDKPRSTSTTLALENALRVAKRGDVIREPLPTKNY